MMIPEIKTILYATGLGPKAPKVFSYAVALAQKHDAKITIVNAVEPMGTTARAMVEACLSAEQLEQLKEDGKGAVIKSISERLEVFCEDESCRLNGCDDLVDETLVIEGRAEEVVLKVSERIGADIIVMGTHRQSSLEEIFLGSTAHSVMLKSKAPVFLVRTD